MKCFWGIAVLLGVLAVQAAGADLSAGGFFLNRDDVARFRSQQTLPQLAPGYGKLKQGAQRAIQRWQKEFPDSGKPLAAAEWVKRGTDKVKQERYERAVIFLVPDYRSVAIQTLLEPTDEGRRTLREMLLVSIGIRRKFNMWREFGIHEAENVMRFLTATDMALSVGALTPDDLGEIRAEMNRAGHFLEGWLLDNPFSRMYEDFRVDNYCINFHIAAAVALNTISVMFPDLPDAGEWERSSHAGLLKYLIDGNTEDGGYGEGSINYWATSSHQILEFIVLNRNVGKFDYSENPFWREWVINSFRWRSHLTAPDGRSWAVGDGHRTVGDTRIVAYGAAVFRDPELAWIADAMQRSAPAEAQSPEFLLIYNGSAERREPARRSGCFPYAGYSMLRSGWGARDNALFFKYGITYTGRRLSERSAVISGHAHQEALMIELHYRGNPVLADIGTRGRYQDWHTYGGFMKATVGHSAVGLGNPWGYDRLDGKYREHLEKHLDFAYEQPQQNINPADTRLTAFGDLGSIGFAAARVRTYDAVKQERGLIWFPEDSLTIVADRLESARTQPFEWYFTPVGGCVDAGKLIFGDKTAKLQILPLADDLKTEVISRGVQNIPPYYVGLHPDTIKPSRKPLPRWDEFSLLVLKRNAANTDLTTVLMPFDTPENPWTVQKTAANRTDLVNGPRRISVIGADGRARCGVFARNNGKLESYAVLEGTGLQDGDTALLSVKLGNPDWKLRYSPNVNAVVSLKDKTANIQCKPRSGEERLEFYPPRAKPGEELEAPIWVEASFYLGEKPREMLVSYRRGDDLKFDDPEFRRKTDWRADIHSNRLLRENLPFTYDEKTGMATVKLSPNAHQIIWR